MNNFVALSEPWLTELETAKVLDAIQSGWLTQSGSAVTEMERSLEALIDKGSKIESVTTCSNGTTALHLALLAIGVTSGDEVLIPNFAYVAVVNAVLYCGGTPVVVDVDPVNWCIDTEALRHAITERTKAIIVVDNYGFINDTRLIREVIGSDIQIVRDSAESFPAKGGHLIQGLEDFITSSFYANKIVTSGEGGAIWGSNDAVKAMRIMKNQAVASPGNYAHSRVGYNYRISNLHAAVFNAQWERLEEIYMAREYIFDTYSNAFNHVESIVRHNGRAVPWLFTMQLQNHFSVPHLRRVLSENQIESRPGFTCFSEQLFLKNHIQISGTLNNSLALQNSIISLPTNPKMTETQLTKVINTVIKFLKS